MSSVAWKAALGSLTLVCFSNGILRAQGLQQPNVLPPYPTSQAIALEPTDDDQDHPIAKPAVRHATAISYTDDESYGASAVSDSGSGKRSGGWSDRSNLKTASQSSTDNSATPPPPYPSQFGSQTDRNHSGAAAAINNYGAQQGQFVPMPTPGCGPPGGPGIPYVPYNAQNAPYAPAFYPCPYYPPCYCYNGQLCPTSPCLCPPCAQYSQGCCLNGAQLGVPNNAMPYGQGFYGPGNVQGQNAPAMYNQPQNGQQQNSQPQNGQEQNNNQNGGGQGQKQSPKGVQKTTAQSNGKYPVQQATAVSFVADEGGQAGSFYTQGGGQPGSGMGNGAPPPPASFGEGNSNPTEARSDDSGSSSASCNSCEGGCDSCGCDACGCDSCGCGGCGCGCCLPLIHINDCCPLVCCDEPVEHLFGDCCCLKEHDMTLTGWIDAGIMGNGRETADRFNGPETFADRNGEGQANQVWLAWDCSPPPDNCGWFVGGHVDYMFGSDFFFTTAAGLDGTPQGNTPRWHTDSRLMYGFAMPQMYVETDYDDLKIKWGHFFTIIGYEVVPAIGNFFYSHSYTMQYGEPFTHTGILVTKPNGDVTWSGGIVEGWNTFDANTRAGFLGGVSYTNKDWGSLGFGLTTGGDSRANLPGVGPFANRTMYSLVWTRNFTSRFTYVIQHDLGNQAGALMLRGGGAQWFGINQYLLYKLNCCWSAGMRIEWFRDDDGFVVTTTRPGNADNGASFPGNFYEITMGLNYKANANLVVRPEVRWDWYDGAVNQSQTNPPVTSPYNAGASNNQFTFGVDLVYQW